MPVPLEVTARELVLDKTIGEMLALARLAATCLTVGEFRSIPNDLKT